MNRAMLIIGIIMLAMFTFGVINITSNYQSGNELDYYLLKETTEAALLHDFFMEEVDDKNFISRLRKHPNCAIKNAEEICNLNDKQIDIIKTHMFPITFTPPKYMESWIVDIVDDVSAIAEQSKVIKQHVKVVGTFLLILMFHR